VARIQTLPPHELPAPYRVLLDHDRDMTSTLESHHADTLRLRVLKKELDGESLTREVVLETSHGRSVEYGAIRINLAPFASAPRDAIEACDLPLGSILEQFGVSYACRPSAFFRASCPALCRTAFGLEHDGPLFGRRNVIFDGDTRLAEVIEILAPVLTQTGPDPRSNGRV
jgi:hypothetical protein